MEMVAVCMHHKVHRPLRTPYFVLNSALRGGGVYTAQASLNFAEPNFRNVVFHNNLAEHIGAGMYSNSSDIYLENAVFHKNHVSGPNGMGGGLMIGGGEAIIVNSTFYGNWAEAGGGVAIRSASPAIVNSIVHGNGAIVASGTANLFHVGIRADFRGLLEFWRSVAIERD